MSQLSLRNGKVEETKTTKDIEKDLSKVMLALETLVEKKRTIQTEDEELDYICGKMKTSFVEALKKSHSQNKESKDLSARLENVKNEKERIMRDDHELEISNAKLWETT